MADISVIEFAVYGIIAYGSLIMLVISAIKETPSTASSSMTRAMYFIPGMICALVIGGSGEGITLATISSQVLNSSDVAVTVTETSEITLLNPIWIAVHYMIFIVMLLHVILQSLMLLTKRD